MDTNKIAKNLKKYRKAKNLTARQVSYYLKEHDCPVEARSIYDYESGNRTPNVNVFLHLCRLYECSDVLCDFGYDAETITNLEDEQSVLHQYRKLSDGDKAIVKGFIDIMLNVRNKQDEDDEEW
jgi:transcriptional regulator with XRE-family HTH domain